MVRQGATMILSDGSLLGPCLIVDVSAGGAHLVVRSSEELPERFSLVFSRDGQLRRECLVAWRKRHAVGVEFIPTSSAARR